MPTATLTAEQNKALTTRDTSVALRAGAGCGKTLVLTERFLSHLNHRASPDAPQPAELHQLIAITFTDAAAREMRRRIRETCRARMMAPNIGRDEQDYWLRMLRAIEAARVSTIHAFCASLLRSHAIDVGLDPTFGILDQGEADVFESRVIEDVLRERLAANDVDTIALAAAFELSKLKLQLRELLKHRHDAQLSQWIERSPEEVVAVWQECFDNEAIPAALHELAAAPPIREISPLLESVTPPKQKEKFVEAKAELLEFFSRLVAGSVTHDDIAQVRQFAGVGRICSAKDWPSSEQYDQYKTACEKLRKELDKCLSLSFDADAALEAAGLGLALLRLAVHVAGVYEAQKTRENKLDYDDLLARANQLLIDPTFAEARRRLAGDLRLLLVDEFQDTDQLQVDLVMALCGEEVHSGKLFFVGDFKQSIYRFRGAQPEVFHDLRSKVPQRGQLPLNENFRSQPAVLNFVNALFCRAFGTDYEPLRPNRPQATPEPAVEFIWALSPEKNNKGIKGAARAARQQEARWIARRLRQLIHSEEPIVTNRMQAGGGPISARRLDLGDVAILFRTLSDIDVYETALREYGLDYYLVGGHAFYAQQEIYDVLNLLRSVASAADEISLAGVLRSPFFSLEDETLFWLVEAGGTLNDGLFGETLPAQLSPAEQAKAAAAAQTLQCLRDCKDRAGITELLDEALTRTGYDAALVVEFLGERKLANLQKLLEQARSADRGGTLDLAGFIAQLSEFVAREPKEALAATLTESANVIRLMTIHHAKGLEFPLVIVPDLDRRERVDSPVAAFDPVLGPLVPLPSDDDRDNVTVGIDLYREREKRADAEERQRLLYVATTRAADYLILSSSVAGYGSDVLQSDWMKLLADQFDLETGQSISALPKDYQLPQIRVTNREPATEFKPASHDRSMNPLRVLEEAHQFAESGSGFAPQHALPIAPDLSARRQFSVSRLSGQIVRDDAWARYGSQNRSAKSDSAVDPRELGRLVHAVLQRLSPRDENPIDRWCEQLAADHVLANGPLAAQLAEKMVGRFLESPRWSQIAAAAALHREIEFLLAWPPDQISHDGRYLQGYIDCLYQDEAGEWHLVDYKTNDLRAADCPDAAKRYEMQMYVYALAAEKALGRPPAELALHFLRPGNEHVFAWNDAARRRGIELVKQTLEHDPPLNPEP